jgi:four helix bundle protein
LARFARFGDVARYERFEAWQKAHRLALTVYRLTQAFPRHELYGLTSQARRAALSVPANIAEGSAKRGRREFGRYLDIALGSLSEVSYLLLMARDLGLLSRDQWAEFDSLHTDTGKTLWGLYQAVRR